jgi:hypothetical protein
MVGLKVKLLLSERSAGMLGGWAKNWQENILYSCPYNLIIRS